MGTKKARGLRAKLERLRQRFERSRRARKARSRIPDSLWGDAVTMAKAYGVNRTAKTLRLDYYSLKKRVEQEAAVDRGFVAVPTGVPEGGAAATFLELAPPADRGFAAVPAGACDCTLELENASGVKMRVHLKSFEGPDLAALSQSFWNHQP
jgi:hypothetical protein